jgi:gliding motility-associated lipoprotein GldH
MRYIALVLTLLIFACSNDQVKEVSNKTWDKDTAIGFDFTVSDTTNFYSLDFIIKNSNLYRNSNLHLFVEVIDPNNNKKTDRVNYYLANDKGEWLGSKWFGQWKSEFRFNKLIKFKILGQYKLNIKHGMRYEKLEGIDEVGISLNKEVR